MLAWAQERSRQTPEDLLARFAALYEWEQGMKQPTLKQLEKFARATHMEFSEVARRLTLRRRARPTRTIVPWQAHPSAVNRVHFRPRHA